MLNWTSRTLSDWPVDRMLMEREDEDSPERAPGGRVAKNGALRAAVDPPFKDCLGQTGQGKALQSKHNSLGQEGGHQAVCGF